MLKNVTVTLKEEDLRWVRHEAAEAGLSVSKWMESTIVERRRRGSDYTAAFERWKKRKPVAGVDASKRLTREQVHERR